MPPPHESLYASLVMRGMSRRAFLQFSAAMAATLALPAAYAPRIAAAVSTAPRLPVIWLRGQTCGGNTRALLQSADPTTAELFLELVSLEYHERLMAPAGAPAEAARAAATQAAPGGYLAVVEGAIPRGADGAYCTVGGRAFADVVEEVCAGAAATIAVGSCAFDGGAPAAGGGATDAVGLGTAVPAVSLINLPGCPLNVDNLVATIVHYLTFDSLPVTDARQRPLFAYGGLLHNQCERRAHYEFGEFALSWGDEGAQKGWCLYKLGCKGPETFANCPTQRYAEGVSWPVRAGHGCIGCTTPRFWDEMGPAYTRLPGPIPFADQVTADQVGLALVGGVAAVTAIHGAASAVRLRRWAAQERRAGALAGAGSAATSEPVGAPAMVAVTVATLDERPDAPAAAEPAPPPAEPAPPPAEPAPPPAEPTEPTGAVAVVAREVLPTDEPAAIDEDEPR